MPLRTVSRRQLAARHGSVRESRVPRWGNQPPANTSRVRAGAPLTGRPADRPPPVPADCREILLPMMTDQLKHHLERQEDLEACCQLLSNVLEVLYRKDVVSRA